LKDKQLIFKKGAGLGRIVGKKGTRTLTFAIMFSFVMSTSPV
jgi:hypothetical protein